MSRTVSAWVTSGADFLGVAGPFPVDVPWWSEAEQVVGELAGLLGVPVLVLRLLTVEGGEGGRDGHVTYHVEALGSPAPGALRQLPVDDVLLHGHEALRSPWARAEGLRELIDWASGTLRDTGRPVTGPVEQRRSWNLAGLFRLPTEDGRFWLKTTAHFAADEGAVIAAFARVDPGLVPTVQSARPAAARAWIAAWTRHSRGSDPAHALAIAEPLAHLALAVRYQEFLDGIEPSERRYHEGDPAAEVRKALRCAEAPSPYLAPAAGSADR